MNTSCTRIALVTGASRGLGRSTAIQLAKQGMHLIITYRDNESEALDTVHHIESLGSCAVALRLDVADSKHFATFAENVKNVLAATWQRTHFDCLVNNAGIGFQSSFAETTEEQFDLLMNIHLKGTFFLTQKLLPFIKDGGRIINTSSGLARFTLPGYAAYAVMKGGIEVMTRYMAKELGTRGITVNTIAPGAIETDFGGGMVRDNPQINAYLSSVTALGRVGLPDDIGGAVAALLDNGNNWMTGQRIEVSGGMML
jgi:NAD(P)-dependent dehydrogenase (short-subunit alcohol dehydrogenase family)